MSARSLNKVLLIGNLTRDPELRYTPNGTAVCTFGLATNRSWTPNEGGERQEETEYHRIVSWSKLAEICAQLLYKGRKVFVEGRLQTRTWQGQDGQERTSTEVVIDNMIALGAPKTGGTTEDVVDYAAEYGVQATSMPVAQTTDDSQVIDDSQTTSDDPSTAVGSLQVSLGGQASSTPEGGQVDQDQEPEVKFTKKKTKTVAPAQDVADDIPF